MKRPSSRPRLNHTIKQDQFKLLFSMLKAQYLQQERGLPTKGVTVRSASELKILLNAIAEQKRQERVDEEDVKRRKGGRLMNVATSLSDVGRVPYANELQKTVADAKVIIPKYAEHIYSPEKLFREKELEASKKVNRMIAMTSRHSRSQHLFRQRRLKHQEERKEEIQKELQDIRSSSAVKTQRSGSASRFLQGLNTKMHHETDYLT